MKNILTGARSFFSVKSDQHTLAILGISSAFCIAVIIARCFVYDSHRYLFLGWNLFLAWVPVWFTFALHTKSIGRYAEATKLACLGLWFLFLPNAPYVLTDLFHLAAIPGVPIWLDWLILLSCGWTGLLLGFWSMIRVRKWILPKLSPGLGMLFVPVTLLACAYGVYLGRFERWNSWDIVSHPFAIGLDILQSLVRPRALGMTALFSLFLAFAWWCFSPLFQNDAHDR
ncbi:MAG: hypothetical protein FD123_2313 [Bacteroidetes bacterium]|nr:MAG: hypothetical protein FD123_2313 [Bacteroidota bacterium]